METLKVILVFIISQACWAALLGLAAQNRLAVATEVFCGGITCGVAVVGMLMFQVPEAAITVMAIFAVILTIAVTFVCGCTGNKGPDFRSGMPLAFFWMWQWCWPMAIFFTAFAVAWALVGIPFPGLSIAYLNKWAYAN